MIARAQLRTVGIRPKANAAIIRSVVLRDLLRDLELPGTGRKLVKVSHPEIALEKTTTFTRAANPSVI